MRRAVLLLALVALAGCGQDSPASSALSSTAANLAGLRSGTLAMRFEAATLGVGAAAVGFDLRGPFALPGSGELPVADLEYRRFAGGEEAVVSFIATGEAAYIEVDGVAYELPSERSGGLRGATEGRLEVLDIEDWVVDPQLRGREDIDGVSTERVEARLDVVAALNDLLSLAGMGSASGPPLEGSAAEEVAAAVSSATFDLWTGVSDRMLRRLRLEAVFESGASGALREALGDFTGARISFELELADPNGAVSVPPPDDPRPFEELPTEEVTA